MKSLGLDPYFFPNLEVHDELDYVRVHLYETHDIWHVVTGFATDVAGELGLQALYSAQLRVGILQPVLLAAGMLNAALFDRGDVGARLEAMSRGWRLGQAALPLFGKPWAGMWSKPLAEIRADLGLDVAATPAAKDDQNDKQPAFNYGAAVG
jgi:ubiquinone biosynthesis protein Coq4